MNPTPAAVEAIKAELTSLSQTLSSLTDAQVVTLLNVTTMAANPVAQGQVLPVLDESLLAAKLSNASLVSLMNWVNFGLVKTDIDNQNYTGVAEWGAKLLLLGLIQASEATAIESYCTTTIADPTYQATVPWSMANLGRLIDTFDVEAVRSSS